MTSRNFASVLKAVKKVAPNSLKEYLEKNASFWAPEICWERLTESVHNFVAPTSTNPVSVAVYAQLLGCSKWKMKRQFVAAGL